MAETYKPSNSFSHNNLSCWDADSVSWKRSSAKWRYPPSRQKANFGFLGFTRFFVVSQSVFHIEEKFVSFAERVHRPDFMSDSRDFCLDFCVGRGPENRKTICIGRWPIFLRLSRRRFLCRDFYGVKAEADAFQFLCPFLLLKRRRSRPSFSLTSGGKTGKFIRTHSPIVSAIFSTSPESAVSTAAINSAG